jgi:hypothetical protein
MWQYIYMCLVRLERVDYQDLGKWIVAGSDRGSSIEHKSNGDTNTQSCRIQRDNGVDINSKLGLLRDN